MKIFYNYYIYIIRFRNKKFQEHQNFTKKLPKDGGGSK